jgi:hypothetical protein
MNEGLCQFTGQRQTAHFHEFRMATVAWNDPGIASALTPISAIHAPAIQPD